METNSVSSVQETLPKRCTKLFPEAEFSRKCWPHHHERMGLLPEERMELRRNLRDHLYYRSLPLATGFGFLAFLGVSKGILNANPKYGAIPKVLVASGLGYFIGKNTYKSACYNDALDKRDERLVAEARKNQQVQK